MESSAEFCTSCGSHFEIEESIAESSPRESPEVVPLRIKPKKKPMQRSKKILLFAIVSLFIVLISGHLVLKSVYNPERKIAAMNTAYNSQEKENFFKQFILKSGTSGNADNFYTSVKEYGWPELREQLDLEALKASTNSKDANIVSTDGEFISVTSKPVLLGMYNDVTFTILPTEVHVTAPYKDTVLLFDGKEFKTTQDNEDVKLGSYIPGTYEWSYKTNGQLVPLAGKGDYKVEGNMDNEEEAELEWGFKTVALSSNVSNAIVFIDGKSTKKTVTELKKMHPIQFNEATKIHAVTKDSKGVEVSSDVLPLSTNKLSLNFAHVAKEERAEVQKAVNVEQVNTVKELYRQFRDNYSSAIYYIDFSYIGNFFIEGSKIKQDYAKFVHDHQNIYGYDYTFLLNDITSVNQISDSKYELYSFETFNYSSYDDAPLNYERKKKYVFIKSYGEFFIESITDLNTKKTKI